MFRILLSTALALPLFLSTIAYSGFTPDVCVQDTKNPDQFVQIEITTGEYVYVECGICTLYGTGDINDDGCKFKLLGIWDAGYGDNKLEATVDTCAGKGKAKARGPSVDYKCGSGFSISDKDITNNSCSCS